MKPKSFLIANAVLTASSILHAAPFTWSQTSATTQTWTTAGNWAASAPFVSDAANELLFFANTTTALATGSNDIVTAVPATLSMNTLTLNARGNAASGTATTVNVAAPGSSTWTIGDGTTSTVNLNALNNNFNGTAASGMRLDYNITAALTLNQATTTFNGNGNAGFLFSGNIGEASAGYGITKNGSSVLSLSGTNNYGGGSAVNVGALVFRNLAAKPATGTHTFAAGTTLGLGVGDVGFFSSTDVTNAFANNMTGDLSNVTRDPATSIGIDTTAGSFDLASSIPDNPTNGLVKLGDNTLTLSGTNTYTGVTSVLRGTLAAPSLADGGTASSIGAAPAGAAGLILSGGFLSYTGATATTDRGYTHTGQANSGINVAGSGVSLTVGASNSNAFEAFNITGAAGSSLTISSVTSSSTAAQANFNTSIPLTLSSVTYLLPTGQFVLSNRGTAPMTVGNITGSGSAGPLFLGGTTTTYNGVISGLTGSVIIGAAGQVMTLAGANTFAGPIDMRQAGTIVAFNSIKNVGGGASALGAPTTATQGRILLGQTTNPMTLRYIGTGDTSNRILNLNGTTATVTLEQAGTGLLKFTTALTATGAGSKSLQLAGSTSGEGEIGGAIVNNSATNVTRIEKIGTGTWTLSGANTYTGTTTVNAGTLALVGGSQTSAITVNAAGTLGFKAGSPTTSTCPVTFSAGSKVAVTGTITTPTEYLLMTASSITGTPAIVAVPPGYLIEIRNGGTELWLDYNPNILTHVIDLGTGTAIEGGTFGTYAGPLTGLPLPPLPPGTPLRSVATNATMTATDASNLASDLTLLFDPTPGTPGGDFNLAFAASDATPPVFGTSNVLAWPASANNGVGTSFVDIKSQTAWTGLTGPIDLSTAGVFLGNKFGTAPQGGTWSGTITLTYELQGAPYDAWANAKGLTGANNAKSFDADKDGRTNLAEFAFDGNPLSGVNDGKVVGKVALVGGQQVLTLSLPVRTGATFSNIDGDLLSPLIDGVVYRIEGDENLVTLADTITEVTGPDAVAIQADLPTLPSEWTYRTFRAPGTVSTVNKAFLRAKASKSP